MHNLKIVIQHSLPGRLRLRLSKPPHNWDKNNMYIKKHEGINSVYYSSVTKSILVYYDTNIVKKEEIIVRAGLALSVEYNLEPVIIEKKSKNVGLDGLVYLSGASIILAGASHLFHPATMINIFNIRKNLHLIAGATTTMAVINHARKEVNRTGIFDPEVLSVFYLIPSLLKSNVLTAAGITWLASFGRHFLYNSEENLVLRAVKVNSDENEPTYDIAITNYKVSLGYKDIIKMIPIIIADGFFGLGIGKAKMLQNMKQISSSHNNQLEGLEGTNSRIFIKIK